jgi:hypothetical protein
MTRVKKTLVVALSWNGSCMHIFDVTIDGMVQEVKKDECLVDLINRTGKKLGPKREVPGR